MNFLAFPNPVNESAARTVAAGVVVIAASTLIFDLPWLTLVLALGFIARVASGPRFSPLGLLASKVIAPRLPWEPKLVAGPPKRFAQGIGAVVTTAAAILALGFGLTGAAYVLVAMIVVFATLESVLGLCVGCKMFALLMRVGIIPPEVCESCNNIWAGTAPGRS
jgi:hypothetical protein